MQSIYLWTVGCGVGGVSVEAVDAMEGTDSGGKEGRLECKKEWNVRLSERSVILT